MNQILNLRRFLLTLNFRPLPTDVLEDCVWESDLFQFLYSENEEILSGKEPLNDPEIISY